MSQEYDYQWEKMFANPVAEKNILTFDNTFGYKVLTRDKDGNAKKVQFDVLNENRFWDIYIIGQFNSWGDNAEKLEKYRLKNDNGVSSIIIDEILHKDEYKFLIKDSRSKNVMYLCDPATTYFADNGNSVFWDFESNSSYKLKYDFVDLKKKAVKVIQTDLFGLISNFKDENLQIGYSLGDKNTYKFIRTSGVIKKIKEMGFNVVQFLPFNQCIDGNNWKLRYLIPFHYAIQKNWGDVDEFLMMIDEFHKEGIAVMMDLVIGHVPYKDYKIFMHESNNFGVHAWLKENNEMLYLKDETFWGTKRIDFDNSNVRKFYTEIAVFFMKNYRIDSFRIDNIDGIIRYGANGDGNERENGRTFLRETNKLIYSYNPSAIINYEAHYYYGDNSKMLVADIDSNPRALGATCYNSSRLTYYFHTDYMFLSADKNSVWPIKHVIDEQEWGKSNSTMADFHNHDAAAGLMSMRCTGAYAYNCMVKSETKNSIHAIGKIKVMEAIISFCCEGRTLDLLQTFLLQEGTFEHNSAIDWSMIEKNQISHDLVGFKTKINKILDDEAFAPINVKNRKILNIDDKNKVVVVSRSSDKDNFVVIINTSNWNFFNYKVGLLSKNDYVVIFNSDQKKYAGIKDVSIEGEILVNQKSCNFEKLEREIELFELRPYEVIVLKEIKKQ